MTVSDQSAAPPAKPKPDWKALRYEYETSKISQRKLADKYSICRSTMFQRCMREKWSQRANLVRQVASKLEADLTAKSESIIREELSPWIEQKKIQITKRGYKLGTRGMSRIENLWRTQKPVEAKIEADAARAAETCLRMARTSLGMNDGMPATGALNVQILTNQAAIQFQGNGTAS